jgi:AraC-like DNA-binding protein/ligand-binding sensor protein
MKSEAQAELMVADRELIEKLKTASFYQVYQNAFRTATGLPLVLVSADSRGFNPCHASANQNPFCRSINTGAANCEECVLAQNRAIAGARERAQTVDCFAGMKETAVPLRLGKRVVGYLKTGQVFTKAPLKAKSAELKKTLLAEGHPADEVKELITQWSKTPVFAGERYDAMITLLSAFGLQLATLMNRILLENRPIEPEAVRKAKQFILGRLDERISLERVAQEVNVSTYYFCKIFKQSTGMTFTEYVNRLRIESAKCELLKPDRRITEVAYDVGYQSLSQFNRSFLKIVGESPTEFRKNMSSVKSAVLVA